MTLAQFTRPELLIPRLNAREAAGALEDLSRAVARERCVPAWQPLYQAAWDREQMASTDLEPDMAFPHARLPDLEQVIFAFGRSAVPLRWGLQTRRPVRLVFLIAVPANDSSQYLQLISGLARLSQNPRLVEGLHRASEAPDLFAVFQEVFCGPGAPPQAPARESAIPPPGQPPAGAPRPS